MFSDESVCPSATEDIDRLRHKTGAELPCEYTEYDNLKWYAVRTYSFRERVVAQSFASKGICHYLPLISERHRWSDRIKTIQIPLFKNYVFVRVAPTQEDFWKVLGTCGVTRILGDERGPISISDKEIEDVERMLANRARLKVVCGFQSGQPIRIKSGPLQGMEGSFVQMKGKDHLAVYLKILGQTVLAEVNYYDVEPC